MRIVVTGATGNVGTSLVRALSDDPTVDSIVGIARRAPRFTVEKTSWATADVERDDLVALLRGADAVVHLAWLIQPSHDERSTHRVNVDGSARVFDAAAIAGVPAIVYASSVGAYSPGPKDRSVDESWPTDGIASSFYARHKAAVERSLDAFESAHPDMRIVRLRPALIFKREAASEIRRLFVGPLVPGVLMRPGLVPVVPRLPGLRFQAVHTDDVAQAYRLAAVGEARGAFNIAADPVLDVGELKRVLHARATLPLHPRLVRALVDLTWRAHLQPTPAGWLDMALSVPIMSTRRAREELGWCPRFDAREALAELLEGLRQGAGVQTEPLRPGGTLAQRARELSGGVGAR